MSYFIENETYLQCPYDKSHQILNYRFQTHLVKCAKNHPDKNLIVCPFNSTHLYSKENLSVSFILLLIFRNLIMNI